MASLAWIALWLFPVAVLALVLWRREARRLGVSPGPLKVLGLVGLVVLGGLLYLSLGYNPKTAEWLADYHEFRPVARQLMAGKPAPQLDENTNIRALAMTLQRELARDPSAPGWYTLAMVFNEAGRGNQAVEAARRALKLASEEQKTPARVLLARSLINRDDGRLTPESEALLRQVLRDHPDHDGAWTLLAMASARAGRHELSVQAFESLLSRHGEGEAGEMLRRGLARARDQAERQAAFADIRVTVSADQDVATGGTLFVFLRPEGGAGQPLAARRYLANTFPLTLSLRAEDWLQAYPDPGAALVVGARYSSAPGGNVETASLSAGPVALDGRPGGFHADLLLKP